MLRTQDKNIDTILWKHEFEEEHVLNITADIFMNGNGEQKFGEVSLYVFDRTWDEDLFVAADSVSDDTSSLIEYLLEREEETDEEFLNVAVIDRVFIKEEYRGKGLGEALFTDVFTYLMDVMKVNILSLVANPLKENETGEIVPVRDDEEGKNRLINWYKGFGFKQLSKDKDNYLFVDTRVINRCLEEKRGF